MKIYLRVKKRRSRAYLGRWRMQTELRKMVLANYSMIFSDDGGRVLRRTHHGINQDTKLYEHVKKIVLGLSSKYVEKMASEIAKNLSRDSHYMKRALNTQLSSLVNDILQQII